MIRKGLAYILLATFAFALMNILAKSLSTFHPMQVVFFRAFGTFVFILPYMLAKGISLAGNRKGLLFLRAIMGFLSLSTFFWAVQRIPLGSAISIRYVGPIFSTLLGYSILKERVNFLQWVSLLFAFSGVLLLKGIDTRVDLFTFILVLISALFVGIVFITIRLLTRSEDIFTIIFYFMATCILGSLLFIPYWRMPIGSEWIYAIAIGIFGLIGQVLMTLAFKFEEASTLAPFKYMELVYALIIGFFLFGEIHSATSLVAMGIIISGMVMSVRAKKM